MPFFTKKPIPLIVKENDINFLFDMVRNSSYVQGNPDYRKKAENTSIKFDNGNNQINAYAMSYSEKEHHICIFNGLCNSSIFVSIALAHFKQDNNIEGLKDACRWLGNKASSTGMFDSADINAGITKFKYSTDGIYASEAKSYTAGGILSVIAHEQGHICLSHTQRDSVEDEVSRNDERQADLFGCSVTATTPFSSHIVLASLFMEIVFSWMMDDTDVATTHPHSRERVYNTLNSHDSVLRDLGITKDNIDDFLR